MLDKTKPVVQFKPITFIIGVFVVTWACAVLMTKIDAAAYGFLFLMLDFIESASPLILALILLKSYLFQNRFLLRYILGERAPRLSYVIVVVLFVVQYLNFYLFRINDTTVTIDVFAVTFLGQFLLGGGLEEAGWRGYLLPSLQRKFPILLASLFVSIVWAVWHLPYFILPSIHTGGNFISYAMIGIVTGFILTSIYMLTKSILLCSLFHSWQNTIVMTVQADMQNLGFLVTFLLLGTVSAILCLYLQRKENSASNLPIK